MIGDLVLYRPGWIDEETKEVVHESGTGFPIRLTCLYDNMAQYDDILPDGTINTIEVADYELFPIPLTPEILEKNFEKKTFYGIFDDYFDLDIREYSDGLYIVTYHSCEFNIPDQTIHISWVHELQHFLNHCGITHEIKL